MLRANSRGAAAQGIGWALNEEYIYGDDGRLQNPGFLDYRIPVCSDMPFIDTKILEVPNPNHPYGIRGVGETSIVPPLGAVGNAIADATGVRMTTRRCRHRGYCRRLMLGMQVSLSSMFRVGNGPEPIHIQAASIDELMHALLLRYPDLQTYIDQGIAVSINGQIFRDDWTVAIPDDAEVYLIPRIEGG